MEIGLPGIHHFLVQHYDLDELHTLCFELGVNYDDLAGATLSAKARELILWAGRQRKLDLLLAAMRDARRVPFDQAGLSLEPGAVEALYADLASFESSTAPQSWWVRFRRRPLVFYPTMALIVILALVILTSTLVSIMGGMSGAEQQLRELGVLPAPLAFPPSAKDEALIVVATFHEAQGVIGTEAQKKIRKAIQQAAGEAGLPNLRVEVEPTQLTADDRAGAEALGKRYDASMVIWGSITGIDIIVNYLNLKQPNTIAASVEISETERTQLADSRAYSSFITRDLPGQLSFLALFAVGQSLYSQGKYAESIRVVERAVASVQQGQTLRGLADAYFHLGYLFQFTPNRDDRRAIDYYSKAIDSRDGFARNDALAEAYRNRGMAKRQIGDVAGAIDDYNEAIKRKDDDAYAYLERGVAKKQIGNPAEAQVDLEGAIRRFSESIKFKGDDAYAYLGRGRAKRDSGDLVGAIEDLAKADKYKDDLLEALTSLCWLYAVHQQPDQAMPYCERAVKIDPQPANRNTRALSYALLGDYPAAIDDFQTYIDWAEKTPGAQSQAYLTRHKGWVEALRANQNPFTSEVLAEFRGAMGTVPR